MNVSIRKIITLWIMLGGAIMGFLAQTILSTAIPLIMGDLSINAGEAQWLTALYLLVLGVMIPPSAYLIRRFSTRILVNVSLTVFTLGSLLGFMIPTFSCLLIARTLQAAGCGIILPALNVAIFKVLPKDRWNTAMGILGLAICLCPVIGPTLGGILVDAFGWTSIFLILFIIGAVITIISYICTANLSETEKTPLDVCSLVLSIVSCVGIIAGISDISSFGLVSVMVWLPLIIGIVCLIIFVKRQNKLHRLYANSNGLTITPTYTTT